MMSDKPIYAGFEIQALGYATLAKNGNQDAMRFRMPVSCQSQLSSTPIDQRYIDTDMPRMIQILNTFHVKD